MARGSEDLRDQMSELLSGFLATTGLSQVELAEELTAVGYSVRQPNLSVWINAKRHAVTPKSYRYMAAMLERVRSALATRTPPQNGTGP